ncbi:MAG: Sodium/glucose cotransporter [Flavobacterium sp. SCGC AAA160-P02]|nr:MAG: Sodium/glucose cotransporter [Flavobacterium sp. SCGC AAA160-P02]
MIDFIIVIAYFSIILIVALRGKVSADSSADEYFLSSRNLPWYSIAFSTIATNIQGYQFLGMMGSAYLFGLAQANLEINAVQGILLGTFVFVPLFLREKITTITQFIAKKLGERIALLYSLANIALFATVTLGAALFWGAYAADMVFGEQLSFFHENRLIRIAILIVILGIFSAVYTYFGGLRAVVKTDIIQFGVLLLGGIVVCLTAIHHLGGWEQLYIKTPQKMHLHLPSDHPTLPWTHLFGLFFLNINYWCANQTVIQRALAAKSVTHAQTGLMVGGLIKYLMAILIIVPGIALYGMLGDGLEEPDLAFPYLVKTYLPQGIKGIILCGLFASLMSTVDSTFNSLATLWSTDIYTKYINRKATDQQKIRSGRRAILFSLGTALIMGLVLLYLKFDNPNSAFTHTLNNLRYYINCGIVILICSAVLLVKPNIKVVLIAFIASLPINIVLQFLFPEMNYFVRAFCVIISGLSIALIGSKGKINKLSSLFQPSSISVKYWGWTLAISLLLLHFIFH